MTLDARDISTAVVFGLLYVTSMATLRARHCVEVARCTSPLCWCARWAR